MFEKKGKLLLILLLVIASISLLYVFFMIPEPPKPILDSDNDGIPDAKDNCPNISNTNQSDLDLDKIGDACDNDIDGDGILNLKDNCPYNKNPEQFDLDNDSKGDACDFNILTKYGIFDPVNEVNPVPKELRTENESGYFVIQFFDDFNKSDAQGLLNSGEVLGAVPRDAILFKSNLTLEKIRNFSYVRYAEIYQPAYKLSVFFKNAYLKGTLNDSIFNIWIITFTKADEQDFKGFGNAKKIEEKKVEISNVSGKDILDIIQMGEVEYVQQVPVHELANNVASSILHVVNPDDGVRDVHGLTGKGQTIAVADSGLDNGSLIRINQDFRGRIKATYPSFTLNPSNSDTRVQWSDPFSAHNPGGSGHGTHVAGSVLGSGANSNGTLAGVAPNASLIMMSLQGNSGRLSGIPSDYSKLFKLAYDHASIPRIITNSWGGNHTYSYSSDSKSIDAYARKHDGFLIIFAVGNHGRLGPESLNTEANSKNALVVGATESLRRWSTGSLVSTANNTDDVAVFSGRGPATGDRIKPDLVAPGTYILSVRSSACQPACSGWGLPGALYEGSAALQPNYMYMGGTSMATPLVAGAAVLTREYYRTLMDTPFPSSALVKATLIQGAQDMPATGHVNSTTGPIPNNDEGFGRLNLTKALFPVGTHNTVIFDDHYPFTDDEKGDYFYYEIRASKMHPLEVTLVWTDDLGATVSDGYLVNDLDLKAESPSGKMYRGNMMTDGVSTPNPGSKDSKNNVEKIIINDTEDGFYNITVISYDLYSFTKGQDYAIIISPAIGVDAADSYNDPYYDFTNQNVNVVAEGLKTKESVDIYVLKYNGSDWKDGINLNNSDVSGYTERFSANDVGIITDSSIWKGAWNWIYYDGGDGRFNIVVDRNISTLFQQKIDLVDYYDECGFTVQAIAASDENGTTKKTFTSSDDYVYVKGGGFLETIQADIYLTPDPRIGYAPLYKKARIVTSNNGTFPPKRIMSSPSNFIYAKSLKNRYTIMADTQRDGDPFEAENDSRDQVDVSYLDYIVGQNRFVPYGDTGNAVSQLQAFLNSQSFKVNVTGNFTNDTLKALNQYQRSRHMNVDNVVDISDMVIISSDADPSFRAHAVAATDNKKTVQRVYVPREHVYAKGGVYSIANKLDIYVIKHNSSLKNGARLIDVTDGLSNVTADTDGIFSNLLIWPNLTSGKAGYYDVVVDVDQDGFFNSSVDTKDIINFHDVEDAWAQGETVISEGDAALEIEAFLKTFWDRSIDADSLIGEEEVDAWKAYQRSRGLSENIQLDQATLNQMKAEASISFRIQAVESSDEKGIIKSVFIPTEEAKSETRPVCTDAEKKAIDSKVAVVVGQEPKESIYAVGKGFILNTTATVYVVNSSNWKDGMKLHDESGGTEGVRISSDGGFGATKIWSNIKREDAGLYDVIVDVDGDGFFNDSQKSRDAADQRINWGVAIPRVDSADSKKEITDLFKGPQKVYAKGVGFVPGEAVAIYVTDNNDSWEDGADLSDETEKIENVTVKKDGTFFEPVWELPEVGRYDIVVDRNKDKKYNKSIDVIDMGRSLGFEVQSNWTVMVYMAAEKNLRPEALEDINEMEKIGSTINSTVVVQVDLSAATGTTTRIALNNSPTRLLIKKDSTSKINSTKMMVLPEASMGSSGTLTGFVKWAAQCFPAENYVLVLWGDGDGWKTNPSIPTGLLTDTEPGNDAMQMTELKGAITSMPSLLNGSLDILAFDAPLMATVEVATQVKNGSSIMVASQGTNVTKKAEPPTKKNSIDWDYEDLIKRLNKNPSQKPKDYAKQMVASGAKNVDTISAIQLSGIDSLNSDINMFASKTGLRGMLTPPGPPKECPPYKLGKRTALFDYSVIKNNKDNVQTGVLASRMKTQTFGGIIGYDVKKYAYDLDETPDGKKIASERKSNDPVWGDMDFIDIKHFAETILANGLVKGKSQAKQIINKLKKGGPVIIDEYHSASFPKANGLSIYFPFQQLRKSTDPIHEYSYDVPKDLSSSIYHQSGLDFTTTKGAIWWKDDTDVQFGRFLKRYYTPVSDAVIVTKDGDVKIYEVYVSSCGQDTPDSIVGDIEVEITFSGEGSSGSDFEAFSSFGSKKQSRYGWDFGDDESCQEIWNDKPKTGNNDGVPQGGEIVTNTCDKVFDGIAKHTYDECGCYVATLTTTDDDGKTDMDWVFVDIKELGTIWCGDGVINQPWEECEKNVSCKGGLTCVMPGCVCVGIDIRTSCAQNTGASPNTFNASRDYCTDDCDTLGSGYECNPTTCVCEKKKTDPTCAQNTKVINVPLGSAPPVCIDDCESVYGKRAKCDPVGCYCTKLITPRCGDGVVSPPGGPGGGNEECDTGKNATDTCPDGYECSSECKCVPKDTEGLCGDGIVTPPEECDQGSKYTEYCYEGKTCYNCKCQVSNTTTTEQPYCGNNKKEGSEQCDGTDKSACASNEVCESCKCVGPPTVDCSSWCSAQGYSYNLGSGYSSVSGCSAAAYESEETCYVKCIYAKFGSWTNTAGTSTCCCKDVYKEACTPVTGGCECPDNQTVSLEICPEYDPE